MPVRGEGGAPIFDAQQPAEIKCFFNQLETLFTGSAITNKADKKTYTICYADYSMAGLWEAIPEYLDAAKTYDDFKKAIISGYTDEKRKYSVLDLDLLVGERQRLQFPATPSSRNASGKSFWSQGQVRLHIRYLNHYLDDAYKIAEVFDAAQFALRGHTAISHPSKLPPKLRHLLF
ncbi:hypothetical protein GALMADRAFT_209512 [Galerina marginata CBS 339.88]|uniref:Uncharacterized protein n=1 Tax=Galerina marginata (strain CBS 339.88) TaxID=685588 RepID=A0A067TGF4_GALM3|nr:hypothetical protein GALMADRAFT_209512 [Galerina marginata CBS 339.88]